MLGLVDGFSAPRLKGSGLEIPSQTWLHPLDPLLRPERRLVAAAARWLWNSHKCREEILSAVAVFELKTKHCWSRWRQLFEHSRMKGMVWSFSRAALFSASEFRLWPSQGITAGLNLINWWELSARLPDLADLASLYGSCGIEFSEADSEDRLFFDIAEKSWPVAEAFLVRCQKEGLRVLVNCKAGHNRSACICVCWLMIHEGMTLMEAVEFVQLRRGTILSNHGFRLQLVRLALQLGCRGTPTKVPSEANRLEQHAHRATLDSIIAKKRLTVKYEHNSRDCSANVGAANLGLAVRKRCRSSSLISAEVEKTLSQRTLKMELLACLYHRGKKFSSEYEYTSTPPTVIGSGFSGDVVLCRRREQTAVRQNKETFVRCVKTFDLQNMAGDKLEKLKNEAVIYLSLDHPHIARLFDVYEDADEVSLVMQYCSGGTLEEGLKN
ncbi:unnamed protein product [Polarella glacialis]|uniref:protein-tyrosine-phosphatase n=1 Tax=Polarella glacialis TaxID=89957 RepID=A0A813D749_POLGL|nr:unnamed protein product [Polarella glacialis]